MTAGGVQEMELNTQTKLVNADADANVNEDTREPYNAPAC